MCAQLCMWKVKCLRRGERCTEGLKNSTRSSRPDAGYGSSPEQTLCGGIERDARRNTLSRVGQAAAAAVLEMQPVMVVFVIWLISLVVLLCGSAILLAMAEAFRSPARQPSLQETHGQLRFLCQADYCVAMLQTPNRELECACTESVLLRARRSMPSEMALRYCAPLADFRRTHASNSDMRTRTGGSASRCRALHAQASSSRQGSTR